MKTHYLIPKDRIHEIEKNIEPFGSLDECLEAFCESEEKKKEIQCITLNKDLFANVRIGKKVSMTVPGVKDFNVGNAYFVDPEDNDKRCKVVINTIFLSTFEDNLKDEMHCKLEGYDTKRQFLDYMYGNYGKIEPQDIMTTIFFSYRQVEGV